MDTKRKEFISHEKFVKVWQASPSLKHAAASLGMAYTSAAARADYLRKKGVRLKHFGPKKLGNPDVAALNKLCDRA